MQAITTEKITAARARQIAKDGLQLVQLMDSAEGTVYRNINLANYRAWQFGKYLIGAKDEIGHGVFTEWRAATFPKVHERKARRCQELFTKNANRTELSDLSEQSLERWIAKLDDDSVRKFRLGFGGDKKLIEHAGNQKFPRLASFVNIANEYNRLQFRHTSGLQLVDFDEACEETSEMLPMILWLHREKLVELLSISESKAHSLTNPWAASK